MSPKVLDAEGRELKVGDAVKRLKLLSPGWVDTWVRRIGWRKDRECPAVKAGMFWSPTEPTGDPDTFRCPDLLLADQPTKEGSRHG